MFEIDANRGMNQGLLARHYASPPSPQNSFGDKCLERPTLLATPFLVTRRSR